MIGELIGDWIKGILIDGIMGNLSGLFSTVNTKVGEIASDVGTTPQAWNSGIFNMLQSLSDTVIVPIAAAILAVIMCYELIDMIVEKNNMHDFHTSIGIIKNEKYKGDILMGKTFTLDPISKRRLDNFGEEDQFYIRDHHEAIISEEMFEKAQEILKRRAKPRRLGTDGKREKFSRKYAFSCMLECGFCGGTLTRRSWHSGSQYNKVIWQCVTATKKGKKFCPDSKGIAEETIEQAFIESYRLLCQNNKDVLDEFIARTEETLSDSNASKQLAKVEKDIAALDAKRAKLVDMRLEEIIDKETYEQKYFDLSSQIEQLQKQRESLQESAETESTMKKRIAEFRRTLEENEVLDTFDRYVFESIVEKVIVGGYDEDGNKDPAMLTFIYKTGFKNSLDGTNFKPPRKNSKAAKQNAGLCSHTTDEAKSMCSYHSDDTRGVRGEAGENVIRKICKGYCEKPQCGQILGGFIMNNLLNRDRTPESTSFSPVDVPSTPHHRNNVTVIISCITIIVVALVVAFSIYTLKQPTSVAEPQPTPVPTPQITNTLLAGKIEGMSELTTAKLSYNGFLQSADGNIPFLTKKTFFMTYHADVKVGFDLSAVEIEISDSAITITLPPMNEPEITIDPESIKFYNKDAAIFNWTTKEDAVEAIKAATADVNENADIASLKEQSDSQARTLLASLLKDYLDGRNLIIN